MSKLIVSVRSTNSMYRFNFQLKTDLPVSQSQFVHFLDYRV